MTTSKKIKQLIKQGAIEKAIELLLFLLREEQKEIYDDIIVLSGQFHLYKKEAQHKERNNQLNRVILALTILASEVEDRLLPKNELIIESKAGLDYSELITAFEEEDWEKADKITRDLFVSVANKDGKGLSHEELHHYPMEEFHNLDRLWTRYSDGRFGFGVQLRKLIEADYNPNSFAESIGWKKDGLWIAYSDMQFNLLSPKGQLPILGQLSGLTFGAALFQNKSLPGYVDSSFQIFKSGLTDLFNPGGFNRLGKRFIREFGHKGGNGFALWWIEGRIELLTQYAKWQEGQIQN